MKSFAAIGVVILAMLGLSGSFASTASARCAVVVGAAGSGIYNDAACTEVGGGKEYVKVKPGGKIIEPAVECAEVEEPNTEEGHYTNDECFLTVGQKRYFKVIRAPRGNLCAAHEEPCGEKNTLTSDTLHLATSIGLLEGRGGSGTDLLCLAVLSGVDYGSLGAPQSVAILSLSFSTCGTEGSGGSHSNCGTVSALHLPYFADLEKTALNLGTLEILDGEGEAEPTTLVKCTVFGFIKVECEFSGGELGFHFHGAEGGNNGLLLAEGVLPKIAGGSLCPEESEITTGILEPLTATYIVG